MRFDSSWFIAPCLLLLWALSVSAKPGAIEFEADSIHYDHDTGSSVYRGNVRVTQGDMLLRGDEIEVFSDQGSISRIISRANPSIFQDQSAGKDLSAEARRIEYDASKSIIVLSGDAKVYDGKKILQGERIVYDLKKGVVDAVKSKGRVRLRIDN